MVALALATLVAAGDGPVGRRRRGLRDRRRVAVREQQAPTDPEEGRHAQPGKQDATPLCRMALRRARWRDAGLAPVAGVAAATLFRVAAARDFPEAARRSWSRRIRSAWSMSFVGSVIGLTPRARSARRLAHLVVGMALGHGARRGSRCRSRQSARGDADVTAGTGVGDDAAEDPSAPEEAPTANSTETTLIVIAPAVAIAVFLSIVCSSLRVPAEPIAIACHSTQPKPDEGRRTTRMKLP